MQASEQQADDFPTEPRGRPAAWPPLPLRAAVFPALVFAAICACAAELALGPIRIDLPAIFAVFAGSGEPMHDAIILQIRLPRLVLGIAVGVALAVSGAALQGMLRNPLAEPALIGVTAGASLGAVSVIVLGGVFFPDPPAWMLPLMVPFAAFICSGAVIAILFALASVAREAAVTTIILAGVAINAIVAAGIGVMIYMADDQQLRDLTFWTLGSLGAAETNLVVAAAAIVLLGAPVLFLRAHALDLLQLGEREAFHAGLNVAHTRLWIAVATALCVGAVTSAAGPIGFIGLVAPHIARLLVGPMHRRLLPASALIGVILVILADLGVRLVAPPAEPPIGLATGLIGGPFFLWLLLRQVSKGRIRA